MSIEKSVPRLASWCQTVIPRDRFFYPHQTAMNDSFSCTSFLFSLLVIIFNEDKISTYRGDYVLQLQLYKVPLITSELSQRRVLLRRGSGESVQIRLFRRCLTSRLIFRWCRAIKIQTSTFLRMKIWHCQEERSFAHEFYLHYAWVR